ncbi:MAG: VWA domain-containing protein [Acidilobaceae archaeon]
MPENRGIAIVLDVSLSMGKPYGDLVPSKLAAVVEAVAFFGRRALESGACVSLAVFHENAVPILPPTRSYKDFIEALSEITRTYEGSSLGDGIIWGVKLLRQHRGQKMLVAITDGEVTGGVPVKLALAYARASRVDSRILLIGDEAIHEAPLEIVRRVKSKEDLARALGELLT